RRRTAQRDSRLETPDLQRHRISQLSQSGHAAGRYLSRVHRADSGGVEAGRPAHHRVVAARNDRRPLSCVPRGVDSWCRADRRRKSVTADARMDLEAALAEVRRARGAGDVVITTMAASKIWMEQSREPHPLDFVFVPSCMGHATSIGLGIALAQPKRRVIVCNGDGSMLMNLGSLVTITAADATNLVVIVLDNGVYEVTGAE